MDFSELSALWAGVKIYAGYSVAIGKKLGCTGSYVKDVLAGRVNNWQNSNSCAKVIAATKEYRTEMLAEAMRLAEA